MLVKRPLVAILLRPRCICICVIVIESCVLYLSSYIGAASIHWPSLSPGGIPHLGLRLFYWPPTAINHQFWQWYCTISNLSTRYVIWVSRIRDNLWMVGILVMNSYQAISNNIHSDVKSWFCNYYYYINIQLLDFYTSYLHASVVGTRVPLCDFFKLIHKIFKDICPI